MTLLLGFLLVLPTLVNLEPLKQRILSHVSQTLGGRISYERAEISFFPRPFVTIYQTRLSMPGTITGTIPSLRAYPKTLDLLKGKIRLGELRLEEPVFTISRSGAYGKRTQKGRKKAIGDIREKVVALGALLALNVPDLVLYVEKGSLNFTVSDRPVFSFKDVRLNAACASGKYTIDLSCKSNLWEQITVKGDLRPKDFIGSVRIKLVRFQPHMVTDYLFPEAGQGVVDSVMDVDLRLKADGSGELEGEMASEIPRLTLVRANRRFIVESENVDLEFRMREDELTVSMGELDLRKPRIKLSGNLSINGTPPKIYLKVKGKGADIPTIRNAVQALAGDISIIREIFRIVKGGKIPVMTFHSGGGSFADLGKLENFRLEGRLFEGNIFIPQRDLNLEEVAGELFIADGILQGANLNARLGNALGRNGRLKLGLKGRDTPFHLEIDVQTKLAQLVPILKKIVENKDLLREMNRIKNIKGRAKGRLILGGTISSIKPRVHVSECSLSCTYEKVPYPFRITSGQFSTDFQKIDATGLDGHVGASSFSGVIARLDWTGIPYLKIRSGRLLASMAEIYPWLSSYGIFTNASKDVDAMKGSVSISELYLNGPLLKPLKWEVKAAGEFKNVEIHGSFSPHPLTVAQGAFEEIQGRGVQKISIREAEISLLDASLKVSGTVHDHLKGMSRANVALEGDVGLESIRWLGDMLWRKELSHVRSPFHVSEGFLVWNRGSGTSFSGQFDIKEGPKVSLELMQGGNELLLKELSIRDKESSADLMLGFKKGIFDLSFSGRLFEKTLDKIFRGYQFHDGWAKGDFRARIQLDQPLRSTAHGTIKAVNLNLPWHFKSPLKLDHLSLDAKGNRLMVEKARMVWGENRFDLHGRVDLLPKAVRLDMDIDTHVLDEGLLQSFLENRDKNAGQGQKAGKWAIPVQGSVRIRVKDFKYRAFTWHPLHAHVSFNGDRIKAVIEKAEICGISTPGRLEITPQGASVDMKLISEKEKLYPTVSCLVKKPLVITGEFDLHGDMGGRAKPDELANALKGNFDFQANNGRIHQFTVLVKIFKMLALAHTFRGKIPDMTKEGFSYETIRIRGGIQGMKMSLHEAIIDTSSIEIIGQGDIDLAREKINLTILVAYFSTLRRAMKHTPLAKRIFPGKLLAVPFRVTGDLANLKVIPLSPRVVGSELLGIMKRTFKLPYEIIQPALQKG